MDMVEWIRSIVASLTTRGRFARIELWHGGTEGQPTRLDTFEELRDDAKKTVVDVERLARHFQSIAQADADSHSATGGVATQRYLLTAHYADEEAPASTCPFAVRGVESARSVAEQFQGSEPASEKGSIAMVMRHSDNLHRLISQFVESGPGVLMAMNRELARQLETERQQNLDRWLLAEAQRDRQQERLIIASREERQQQMRSDLWSLLKGYAPTLVQGLPGGNSPAAVGESLMQLAAGMTEDEMARVASVLSPERRGAFLALLDAVGKEAARRDAEAGAQRGATGGDRAA